MNVEVIQLYRSLELRDYELFNRLVEEIIEKNGWLYVVNILKQGLTLKTDWNLPLRRGVLRDALIKLLDSEIIGNLDCDLLDVFNNKEFHRVEDLRLWVLTKSVNILKEQIERGCTFFLDTQELSTSVHAVLVSEIIEARRKEIENLSSKPHLREVYSTYYGFSILMAGEIKQWRAGASADTLTRVEQLVTEFGGTAKIGAKMMKTSKKAFLNCSSETRELLLLLLRVSMAGSTTRKHAAKRLGEIGDSRAIPIILARLQANISRYEKQSLIKALGKLGHMHLYGEVAPYLSQRWFHSTAIEALAGIRHPGVVETLREQGMNKLVLESLGRTHHPEALRILSENFFFTSGKKQVSALIGLHTYGPDGDSIIRANPEKVALALKRGGRPIPVLKILNEIPDYVFTPRVIKALLEALEYRSHARKMMRYLENMEEIIATKQFVDGFVSLLTKNLRPYRRSYYGSYYGRRRWVSYSPSLIQKILSLTDEPQSLLRRLRNIEGIQDVPTIASTLNLKPSYKSS